jgi:glycine cleavage system regulatory protein
LTVSVRLSRAAESTKLVGYSLLSLRLEGADHEGIVHKVAAYLADRGINVETMQTSVVPAPISASPLFHMESLISIPPGLPVGDLATNLQQIGEELGVNIVLAAASGT